MAYTMHITIIFCRHTTNYVVMACILHITEIYNTSINALQLDKSQIELINYLNKACKMNIWWLFLI